MVPIFAVLKLAVLGGRREGQSENRAVGIATHLVGRYFLAVRRKGDGPMEPTQLRSLLEEHWSAQCQLLGARNLERLLSEAEKGKRTAEVWATDVPGGTPMDFKLALDVLATAISFLELAFKARDEWQKLAKKRPKPDELKAELAKLILDANSPEKRILASDRGQRIIDELCQT